MRKNITALLLFASLCSCTRTAISELIPVLSTDKEIIDVAACSPDGETLSEKVVIRSNRNWGSTLADAFGDTDIDWVCTDISEGISPDGTTKEWIQTISFDNNPLNKAREARMRLSNPDKDCIVTFRQAPLAYSLTLTSRAEFSPKSAATVLQATFECNTDWTARIKEGSEDFIYLDLERGSGDAALDIFVAENYDMEHSRSAVVVISAEDCADIEIAVNQDRCRPTIDIDREKTVSTCKYTDTSARIYFTTNGNWVASASGDFSGVTLSKTSGTPADKYIDVTFDKKYKLGEWKETITFNIADDPEMTDEIVLSQQGGMYIYIPFLTGEADLWSPSLDATLKGTAISGEHTYSPNDFTLEFGGSAGGLGFYQANGLAFDMTGKEVGWIKIPCPEEGKIKSLEIKCLNGSAKMFTVYDGPTGTDGTGANVLAKTVSLKNASVTWSQFASTTTTAWTKKPVQGQAIYLTACKQKFAMIDHITVIIE